jgi:hypothetical protein
MDKMLAGWDLTRQPVPTFSTGIMVQDLDQVWLPAWPALVCPDKLSEVEAERPKQ